MKAAVRNEAGELVVQNIPEPEIGPDRIKVKIAYCGICGSELHSIDPEYIARRRPMPQRPAGAGPRAGGHEASGTIAEIADDVYQEMERKRNPGRKTRLTEE